MGEIWSMSFIRSLIIPIVGVFMFLGVWHIGASQVQTSLGTLPGPVQVWTQFNGLIQEHQQERAKETAFYERQDARNAKKLANNPDAVVKIRPYTGSPTFFDQIITSLITVMTGFILASLIAIPLGIICGMSAGLYAAINPLIQIFKPVSPLAWLPLVTIVVSAVVVTSDPYFPKAFIISAITVTLCCLWPTVINTTIGVSQIDNDLINVSKVLRLNWFTKVRKIVLPSAVPMIFGGLRLSLGIGWMVLIAAEMLAQNPGLGKFVWDEFQNGSSNSLGRIMVAVIVIGLIGYLLDKVMLILQKKVSWDKNAALR
ncbi:MAG: ABC transporter permease [gamma proteobacterium symbiont of Bathyaustriella thionipta]|nr:ABC transporter permease [gamma proteobacterium symbiont of Bathyaustriella thionipta]MCU7950773.1 ABC transporter permease [gamma proteobacterium symbiont of Bathyaustriella thionipta]MCU7954176.1 ABC transporter permease [gamma proteobacterium symbiont of Bathyaustriella thionipta]MCU7957289.1 ABC transporter permease [gamma proteobacterium symbiont of Bathyaustriella thionipta]MCU7965890.1 ABC transporter permease [gamma proteobacterium symbiont of Bathyaustriella thionipta]